MLMVCFFGVCVGMKIRYDFLIKFICFDLYFYINWYFVRIYIIKVVENKKFLCLKLRKMWLFDELVVKRFEYLL